MDMILISSRPRFPFTLCFTFTLPSTSVAKRPEATMRHLQPTVIDPGKETRQSRHVGGILIPTAASFGSLLRPRTWRGISRCPEGHCDDNHFSFR